MTEDTQMDKKGDGLIFEMRRLGGEDIEIQPTYDGVHIIASFYEYPLGHRWYDQYHLSDFPNDLASTVDFERLGINITDGFAVARK